MNVICHPERSLTESRDLLVGSEEKQIPPLRIRFGRNDISE